MTTETNEATQPVTPPDTIALETLLTPFQLSLLLTLVSAKMSALCQTTKTPGSRDREELYASINSLTKQHTVPLLAKLLQAGLADIGAALSVEYYESQFNFYDCDPASQNQFSQALRKAFPTALLYVSRTEQHCYWHLFVPASDGPPSQQTIDDLVAFHGHIEAPFWAPSFPGEPKLDHIRLDSTWELLP